MTHRRKDTISVLGLSSLAPETPVECRVRKPDGSCVEFGCSHTFSSDQLEWFRAGECTQCHQEALSKESGAVEQGAQSSRRWKGRSQPTPS